MNFNKLKAKAVLLTFAISFSGCAHSLMRGTVAMKTSNDEGHVCLGKGEVKTGDRVTIFKNVCTGKGAKEQFSGTTGSCEMEQKGMGTVKSIINDHYSVVKFDPGVSFEEGTMVEKR